MRSTPRSSHLAVRAADEHRRQGRLNEAIALCVKALEARPTYASARVVLGRAYLEIGDQAKAEEEFRRAVQVSPHTVRARLFLARICEGQHRIGEAIGHYRAALFLAPFDRALRARLVELEHATAGRGPEENEVSPFVTETLADLYASQGVMDRAAAIYRRLLEEDPTRGDIRRKLAAALQQRAVVEYTGDGTSTWRTGASSSPLPAGFREAADAAEANREILQGEANPDRERP